MIKAIDITCAGGPVVITPAVYDDDRGSFQESWNKEDFNKMFGVHDFVQDNQSVSKKNVVRGLHFQKPPYAQAKLVRVVRGSVYDVAVDIRKGSPTYGNWYGVLLSAENNKQFLVPRGFAHGFVALEDNTVFQYKCDNKYDKASEGALMWDDKTIGIEWPFDTSLAIVSDKDQKNDKFDGFDSPFDYEKY